MYGAEAWVLYRNQLRRLEQFHQRCLGSTLSIKWQDHVSNEDVLSRAEGRKGLLIKSLPLLPTSSQTVIESALLALVLQATLEHAKRRPSPDLRIRGTAIIITYHSVSKMEIGKRSNLEVAKFLEKEFMLNWQLGHSFVSHLLVVIRHNNIYVGIFTDCS